MLCACVRVHVSVLYAGVVMSITACYLEIILVITFATSAFNNLLLTIPPNRYLWKKDYLLANPSELIIHHHSRHLRLQLLRLYQIQPNVTILR